ncbi:MAG: PEP-CTERM system TPR-repeat protein PrsT [Rhodocyclaceae bacterium]|nr:PEP-CTERM system TPR-repeat protein PrsT [Rhodocyclaceae bacterium]
MALLLSSALLIGGCESTTPEEFLARANDHFAKGEHRAALVELANALQGSSEMIEARQLRARIALIVGDAATAEQDIRKAIKAGLPRDKGQALLVKSLVLQGKSDDVIAETAVIPTSLPASDQASLLAARGTALFESNRRDEAVAILDRAIAIDGSSTDALASAAAAQVSLGNLQRARVLLEKAIASNANAPEPWSVLGELALVEGAPGEADEAFSKAMKNRGFEGMDRAKRAFARLQLGKLDEAEKDLQVLRKVGFGGQPYVAYVSGILHFKRNDLAEADRAFGESVTANPDFLPSRMYLATVAFLLGHREQALEQAQFVLANSPRSIAAKKIIGTIQMSRGEFGPAREVLKEALQQQPDDATSLRLLTSLAMLEGDSGLGVAYARKMVGLHPDDPNAMHLLMLSKLMAGEDLEHGQDAAAANDEHDYRRRFLLALELFRDKHFDEALARAREVAEAYPEQLDPLKLMAACHLVAGRVAEAKKQLEAVLERAPNDPSATAGLAKIEAAAGNQERAKALLEGLIKERPGNDAAILQLSEIQIKRGDFTSAVALLEEALRSNPEALAISARLAAAYLATGNVTATLNLTEKITKDQYKRMPGLLELRGKALLLSGNVRLAQSRFEEWVDLDPGSPVAHYLLGDALARQGRAQEASAALQRSLALAPRYLPARIAEVKYAVNTDHLDEARKLLERLDEHFGDRAEVHGIQGWFALGIKDFANAEKRLARAQELAPSNDLVVLLMRARLALGKSGEAIGGVQQWIDSHPDDIGTRSELALALIALGREEDARRVYAATLERFPDHVPSLNNQAWLSRDTAPREAMSLAQRAYALAPTSPQVLDTMGMLSLGQGDPGRAYDFSSQAVRAAPDDLQIMHHHAEVLIANKRLAEARRKLEAIVRASPKGEVGKQAQRLLQQISAKTP